MKKKLLSIILAATMLMSGVMVQATEITAKDSATTGVQIGNADVVSDSDEGVLTFVEVNPAYADIISEADILAKISDDELVGGAAQSFTDENELVTYLKQQMKARNEEIEVSFTYNGDISSFNPLDYIDQVFVEDENTLPDEGDYMLANYKGAGAQVSYRQSAGGYQFSITYFPSFFSTVAQEAQVTAAVNSALASLNLAGKSEVDKVKAIHDYIGNRIVYTLDENPIRHSTYGAIIDGKAVCQGYASLFQRMAREAGLSTRYITGNAGGPHAWNIVKIGDYWYNIDTTWDDQEQYGIIYDFYLKSDRDFKDHIRDQKYLTEEFYAKYPMAPSSYGEEPEAVQLLNKPNTTATLTSIDDETLTVTANGKPKVLIFFNAAGSCLNSQQTIESIDKSLWLRDGRADVYAIDVSRNSKATVRNYQQQIAPKGNVKFVYNTMYNNLHFSYVNSWRTTPLVVVIDKNNKVQFTIEGKVTESDLNRNYFPAMDPSWIITEDAPDFDVAGILIKQYQKADSPTGTRVLDGAEFNLKVGDVIYIDAQARPTWEGIQFTVNGQPVDPDPYDEKYDDFLRMFVFNKNVYSTVSNPKVAYFDNLSKTLLACADGTATITFQSVQDKTKTASITVNVTSNLVHVHTYGATTYTWSADNTKCVAKHTCTGEGCGYSETMTANATSTVIKESTTTEKGQVVYRALFAGWAQDQTKTVELPLKEGGVDKTPGVQEHTIDEIRKYVASRGGVQYVNTTYATVPNFNQPYSAGELSDETNQAALNMVNQMRYIAGLSEVSLNSEYNSRAQAAAMVNAVNNSMSHYPTMPSGMSESLYTLGKTGASKSNLGWGYRTLGDAIVNGWMNDGDSGNIQMLGHRRWVLYPSLKEVGFGYAKGSGSPMTAMHVIQDSVSQNSNQYKNVVWPAKYTPVEYFGNDFPWSLSTSDIESISKINVKLTRLGDNKTWEFKNGSADFYVNNSNYGDKGCIIFRPANMTYNPGDKFTVEVTGLAQGSYSYDVEFFTLEEQKHVDHTYGAPSYTWSADKNSCEAKRVCTVSGCNHTEKSTATVTVKVTKESTTTEKGVKTYTATFIDSWAKTQTATEELPLKEEQKPDDQKPDDQKPDDQKPDDQKPVQHVDITKFPDVVKGKWYTEGVQYVNDYGIMTGYADGSGRFGTNDPLIRAQFATMLYRIAGTPTVNFTGKFPDVVKGKYYSDAVEWCAANGIVTGNTNTGMFMYSNNITRQDLALMIYRYANYIGMDTSARKPLDSFTDGAAVKSYAKEAISWCAAEGIVTGNLNPDGTATLDPNGQATRGQCATMVMRFMKKTSNNINDYTIKDIYDMRDRIDKSSVIDYDEYPEGSAVVIARVLKDTEYYYGPNYTFDIYHDIIGGKDMGSPKAGGMAIVYGYCEETGWWRLDLGRSGSYPVVYVPKDCIDIKTIK